MTIQIVLEPAAEEMEFATVSHWHKSVGDSVEIGEPLVEIEADKTTYDIDAPASGILGEIFAVAGDEVAVGSVLANLEDA